MTGSRTIVASLDTADFSDCTNTGWRLRVYRDGHMSAEYVSCWSGSVTGERWTTDPEYVNTNCTHDDLMAECEYVVEALDLAPDYLHQSRYWRQTRKGRKIR